MTDVRCPVCGAAGGQPVLSLRSVPVACNILFATPEDALAVPRGRIDLTFCMDCGMLWNASFEPELLSYDADYENSLHASALFRGYARAQAKRLIETYGVRDGLVVEIGAGRGEFLELLCGAGRNRGIGIDPSSAADRGTQDPSIRLLRGSFPDVIGGASFDLLICRHVLEHVAEPRRFVATIHEALRGTEAVASFEVPNARWMLEASAVWDVLYEHHGYFSDRSLAGLIGDAGFRIEHLGSTFADQFLVLDASLRQRSDAPTLDPSALALLRDRASTFSSAHASAVRAWRSALDAWRSDGRRVALWGAGTKGVMFLNTVEGVVDAVVDANPAKHGAYVSGTGQPIVPPSALAERPPDVVIALNPQYRAEIHSQLAEMNIDTEVVVEPESARSEVSRPAALARTPRVSIGVPVRNGERYLERALESLLQQTFRDLEIVICDNASDDRTREICLAYARRHPCIHYHRNTTDIGAARNFNRTFELATGHYFKWAAFDDWCDPTFVERCVAVLDADPHAVLCYTDVTFVDENDAPLPSPRVRRFDQPSPLRRGASWLRAFQCTPPVFGVIRADALRMTRMLGSEVGSDKILLTELVLLGPWRMIPDQLLHCFVNNRRNVRAAPDGSGIGRRRRALLVSPERQAWWDPENVRRTPVWRWRFMGALVAAVWRSRVPIGARTLLTLGAGARCIRAEWRQMAGELIALLRPSNGRAREGTSRSGRLDPADAIRSGRS